MGKMGRDSCGSATIPFLYFQSCYPTNTVSKWKGLSLILTVFMLLAWYIYHLFSQQGRFLHQVVIMILFVMIRNVIKNIWFEPPITGFASFLPGDAPKWKVSLTVGIIIFTIGCYCLDECVKRKRAQLTQAALNPSRTEDEQ